ncbi:MAG: extracellular solute-binding protein [Patescibacteria group bacterium]
MKPFQAAVLGIFLFLALVGVFVFATFTSSRQDAIGEVVIWGSLPQDIVDDLLTIVRGTRDDFNGVTYRDFTKEELMPTLVQAIASGRGPDLILFPSSAFVKDGDKLQPISYSTVPRRTFQDTFVEAGEIFLTAEGIAALPMTIDPTVMYWNRTMFANASIARPPKYWDELATQAPKLTKKQPNGSLITSAAPLGSWDNATHPKEILVTLLRQLGTTVITRDEEGLYRNVLAGTNDAEVSPAESAIHYLVDFADPVKPNYSWNRSQKNARDAFLAGTLALYFGPASELLSIRESNPNLNFDVAPMPIARGGGEGVYADVEALAVPRGAANPGGATAVALILVSAPISTELAKATRLPSPRRDVQLDASADQYLTTFRASALKAFAFMDPDPSASSAIFSRMIDNVASGRSRISEAIRAADEELRVLIRVQ